MQYLVTSEWIDPMGNGILNPPQDFVPVLEQMVIPGVQALAKLTADRKILAGGVQSGERAAVFIVEAESNDEVTELLHSLPLWISNKWKVTPLESFDHHAQFVAQIVEQLKSATQ